MGRTKFEATLNKRDAIKQGETAGIVADSMEVRGQLIARMEAGELTKLRKALEVAVEYMRHCYEADFDGHPVHDHIALCESVLESTKGSR